VVASQELTNAGLHDDASSERSIARAFRVSALPIYFLVYRRWVRDRWPQRWVLEHLSLFVLSCWPIVLVFTSGVWSRALRVSGVLLEAFLILECILVTWHRYDVAADRLDESPALEADDRRLVVSYLCRTFAVKRQLLFCGTCSILLVMSIFLPNRPLMVPSPFSYATTVSVGLIVGQALYLNIAIFGVARLVRGIKCREINAIRPQRTSGLFEFGQAVQTHAKAGLLLLALVMIPFTFSYLSSKSRTALIVLMVLATVGVASVAVVGVTVQRWINQPIRVLRDSMIADVSREIETDYAVLTSEGEWSEEHSKRLLLRSQMLEWLEQDGVIAVERGTLLQYAVIGIPVLIQVGAAVGKLVR
jgi:hypothetical protein